MFTVVSYTSWATSAAIIGSGTVCKLVLRYLVVASMLGPDPCGSADICTNLAMWYYSTRVYVTWRCCPMGWVDVSMKTSCSSLSPSRRNIRCVCSERNIHIMTAGKVKQLFISWIYCSYLFLNYGAVLFNLNDHTCDVDHWHLCIFISKTHKLCK